MATHSSILAWNIPWTEEPGGLQSMETGVEHNQARACTVLQEGTAKAGRGSKDQNRDFRQSVRSEAVK